MVIVFVGRQTTPAGQAHPLSTGTTHDALQVGEGTIRKLLEIKAQGVKRDGAAVGPATST
jgi:hypothetical protein